MGIKSRCNIYNVSNIFKSCFPFFLLWKGTLFLLLKASFFFQLWIQYFVCWWCLFLFSRSLCISLDFCPVLVLVLNGMGMQLSTRQNCLYLHRYMNIKSIYLVCCSSHVALEFTCMLSTWHVFCYNEGRKGCLQCLILCNG